MVDPLRQTATNIETLNFEETLCGLKRPILVEFYDQFHQKIKNKRGRDNK
jgi:hypothetical protein